MFRGWPPETLQFLRELEANNEREWFKANRARYDEFVVAPTQALAESLSDLGRTHLFRPWNDTRFHHRPSIKEHVGLAVGHEGAGGYYVEISLDGLLVAAGLHNPASDQVERLRAGVDGARTAASLTRALKRAEQAGLELGAADLVRAPRGYPIDHPRIDLLRRRRIVVSRRHPLRKWIHGPEAGRRIRTELDASGPLVRWIREHVGPSRP